MKGVFCSLTDQGKDALSLIPLMRACSDNVVIWSPGGRSIDRWRADASNFVPDKFEILELAASGSIRLGFRPDWLDPIHRKKVLERNYNNPDIPEFDPEFEGSSRLRGILEQNNGSFVLDDFGSYYPEAERAIKEADQNYIRSRDFWYSRPRNAIPKATLDRINNTAVANDLREKEYNEYAIKQLLRDAWLQSALLEHLGCDVAVMHDWRVSDAYASCYPQPPLLFNTENEQTNLKLISEIVRELSSIGSLSVVEKVSCIENNPDVIRAFRRILTRMSHDFTESIREELDRLEDRGGYNLTRAILKVLKGPGGRFRAFVVAIQLALVAGKLFDWNSLKDFIDNFGVNAPDYFGIYFFVEDVIDLMRMPRPGATEPVLLVLSMISRDLGPDEIHAIKKKI